MAQQLVAHLSVVLLTALLFGIFGFLLGRDYEMEQNIKEEDARRKAAR